MNERDIGQSQSRNASRQWAKYAFTLFLLTAVVVAGLLASHSRDAWWQKYLNHIMG